MEGRAFVIVYAGIMACLLITIAACLHVITMAIRSHRNLRITVEQTRRAERLNRQAATDLRHAAQLYQQAAWIMAHTWH